MIRKGIRPRFKPYLFIGRRRADFHRVFPFRRSWIAIGVLAAMDAVFLAPAIGVFLQAMDQWSRYDSLFDLVTATFLSAWLLGWSVAVVLMTLVLAVLLFGREVIRARPGEFELTLGLPGVGLTAVYDARRMRNLRHAVPIEKSGNSWRAAHIAFDYGANPVAFGSAVDAEDAAELIRQIRAAAGGVIRSGAAPAEDVETPWETEEPPPAAGRESPLPAAPNALAPGSLSSVLLVLANAIPVLGTIFLGWKLSDVMVLYWAESGVIGFFTVCKMVVISRGMALLAVPFFVGHFGGFMAVHFLFIYGIFVEGMQNGASSGGDLAEVGAMFVKLWPALFALFVSHGYSFVTNFLGRGEFRDRTIKQQMGEPYHRIIFMHLVLIFGGGLVLVLKAPEPVLWLVIGLKTWFDLKAHLKEHRR